VLVWVWIWVWVCMSSFKQMAYRFVGEM